MKVDRRAICGPALTIATAAIALVTDHTSVAIFVLAPLFVCIAALAASLSGIIAGLSSAAIAVGCTSLILLDRDPAGIDGANMMRLALLALSAAGAASIIGLLRLKLNGKLREFRKH